MTLPTNFPYPLGQMVEIPLEQITPNPHQPRRSMRRETIDELAASFRVKGQEVAARVRPLTEAEKAANPGVWVMLIGGHRRREAALLNQFRTLKCTVENIAPEQTHHSAVMDNNHEDMDWWDWDLAIEYENKLTQKTQRDLAEWMGVGLTKANTALQITKTLNQAARDLVDKNLQKSLKNDVRPPNTKNKGFSITESHLLALADLEDQGRVHQALQAVLDDYLTEAETKKLVGHLKAGGTVETFGRQPAQATAKTNPARPVVTANSTEAVPDHTASSHIKSPMTKPLAKPSHPAQPDISNTASSHGSSQPSPVAEPETSTQVSGSPSSLEMAGWDILAGIPVAAQIRAKIKKGERPNLGEACILLADLLWRALLWTAKRLWKVIHWFAKELWKMAKESAKTLLKALGKQVYKGVTLVLACAFFLFIGWELFAFYIQHDAWKPIRTIASWVHSNHNAESEKTSNKKDLSNSSNPTSTNSVAPAAVADQTTKKAKNVYTPTSVPQAEKPTAVSQLPTPVPTKGPDVLDQVGKAVVVPGAAEGVKKLFGF